MGLLQKILGLEESDYDGWVSHLALQLAVLSSFWDCALTREIAIEYN